MTFAVARPSVAEIRKAFKDALQGISGLTAYATMPQDPRLPCVVPIPFTWRYGETQNDSITWTFRLYFYLPRRDLTATQLAFDSYVEPEGPNSVPQRLMDDPSLGGVVDSLSVQSGEYLVDGPVGDSGNRILGAFLTVEVFA